MNPVLIIIHIHSVFKYHISIPYSLSYYLFKDILNLCTYFIYSFTYSFHILIRILIHIYSFIYSFTYSFIDSFTYAHLYTHLHILIHILIHISIHVLISYTHLRMLIHILIYIFIYVYSFIYSFHILIHVYSFIYSFTYTHSYTHLRILIHIIIHISIYSCPSMNLFYLEIGIIPIGSSKLKLWHFYAKLVNLPILPEGQFVIIIFQCLGSIFDTGSLYSFKAKVLRVILQFESPKSDPRNSSYVLNNPDYSMYKTRTRIWLEHGPTLSEFLGYIESEFEDIYFYMFGFP